MEKRPKVLLTLDRSGSARTLGEQRSTLPGSMPRADTCRQGGSLSVLSLAWCSAVQFRKGSHHVQRRIPPSLVTSPSSLTSAPSSGPSLAAASSAVVVSDAALLALARVLGAIAAARPRPHPGGGRHGA